jgi:hypothetical protein
LERASTHRFGGQHPGATAGAATLGAAALLDGAVPAADYLWTWSQVDDHLFQAISHMTHEAVDSMADLGRTRRS